MSAYNSGIIARVLGNAPLKAGLPPGTPIHVGERKTERVNITVLHYDRHGCREETTEKAEQCRFYHDREGVSWINVDGLHHVDIIEKVSACFKLHPLTVEDICNTTQRPKLDIFDDYLFLVARTQTYDQARGALASDQISIILGKNFLLTFQESPTPIFAGVRHRINSGKGKIRTMGPDYLAYALLDAVVDSYFQTLENLGEEIETLEEEVLSAPRRENAEKIHRLKREMILLRKSVWPMREILNSLLRHDETELIDPAINIYLKDLYDHTIQVIDTVETYRDITAGLLDIYLGSLSNRMNEAIKVLTMFATIFIPLTFIAGVYGMNFDPEASPWNMPELGWTFGYPLVLALMLAVAGGMLYYFKRKGWL
ncbi:magnesium/cobalt transporter CorA [Desulfurivibrio alkaliphilus]|uniref:Magnesium transport protein CorA n=1 Tax=Desulfurivibrio alkaliphilus (strain DSM 19089 / UNIQEM U267 / AHT2) TaxID=589865 RepID=D6Z5D2_DESAT|nr:magnesium/cobalt transporter CorA [Desulfurivibrio alkaliphilus]ADH84789.1 magnesium and cobalt transport protein CorA [Desulfurivibrio alkaliphilus AHT 2]